MDLRNVIFAIALSFAVLFGWSVIFENPRIEEQIKTQQKQTTNPKSSAPSVNFEDQSLKSITREEAISSVSRIKFANENVEGSISLKGALIDDITFKKYKENINDEKRVTYLNPLDTKNGYFIETGWAASNLNKLKLPNNSTIWKVTGNKLLTEKNPVTLEWNNNSGLIFKKKIELDDKFLFRVSQEIQNNTGNNIELYPYAQITRNENPNVTDFYILHEGFIGVLMKN